MRRIHCGIMTSLLVGIVASSQAHADDARNKIAIDGSTTVGPLATYFKGYYEKHHPEVKITVSESGSGNGATSLINSTCDIASMSRFMKPTEYKAAVEKGILPVAHVVAMDGIAVVVHPANPVNNLEIKQVRDIYAGRITNWKQVGGPDLMIVVIGRENNSGTFETFNHLVMSEERVKAGAEGTGSNGAMRTSVGKTKGAIGYVGLGYIDRTVKAVSINGVEAKQETVISGRYAIARPLFLFTNGYPELGTHLHAFVTLHLTRDGQKIIERIGFVPLTNYREDKPQGE